MALFAEALHTPSDLFVFRFLLVAVHVTGRAPDRQHRSDTAARRTSRHWSAACGRLSGTPVIIRGRSTTPPTVGPVAAEPPT